MIPSYFVILDRLPLNPNGKIDRRALPAPDAIQDRSHESSEPREAHELSDVERLVAKIWSDLLGISVIDANANFFELGGHSLLATRVVSRIALELNLVVHIRSIFEFSELRVFAAHVEDLIINETL